MPLPRQGRFPSVSFLWPLLAAALVFDIPSASGATITWIGGGTTDSIYDAANWSPLKVPAAGDVLIFGGSARLAPDLGSDLSIGSITFNSTASAFTLGGIGTYQIGSGGITNNSTSLERILNNITLTAAQSWNAASGVLSIGGNVATGGFSLTINGTSDTTISGILSGTGSLTKSGAGTLTLSGANTFTGGTTLSAGVLAIGNNSALGSGILAITGGSIQASGGSRSFANAATLGANASVTGANDLAFAGKLTQSGGNRTLTISNTGLTTFAGGIQLTNSSRKRTLTIAGTGNALVSGAITNGNATGSLVKSGTGTLTLSGANTYTGTTTLTAGTVVLGSNTALGTGTVTLNGASLQSGLAGVALANAITLSASTSFAGSLDLTLNGTVTQNNGNRTLTFNGPGLTTFGGKFLLSNNNTTRTLTIAGSADAALNGIVSNGTKATSGNIIKSGTGTLTLGGSAANTFSGSTTVNGGTLVLAKSSGNAIIGTLTIGDGTGVDTLRLAASNQIADTRTITLNAGAIFDLNGFSESIAAVSGTGTINGTGGTLTLGGDNSSTTLSAIVSGNASLAKSGTGILTLSGASTTSGNIIVNAGTVALGAANVLSATGGAIVNGTGLLDLANFNASLASLTMSAGKVQTGTGTLTLGSGGIAAASSGGISSQITGKLSLGPPSTFTISAGDAATDLTISAVISGANGFTKSGTGTLVLSGANSFTGSTTINDGKLQLVSGAAIPDGAAVVLANSAAAILDLASSSETIGSLAGGGTVTLGAGTLTAGGNNASTTFSGAISGSGGVTKLGSGILTLSGTNSFTGATTISAGTLRIGSSTALSSSTAVSLSNSAGTSLDLAGVSTGIGSISGGGAAGGGVTLGGGKLSVGFNGTSTAYSGIISGAGSLEKTGAGTLTLNAAQTFTGALEVHGGTLLLSGATGTAAGATSVDLASGATLTLDNSVAENAQRISDTAPIVLNGGTLRFNSDSNGSSETLGSLVPQSGASTINVVHNGGASDSTSLVFSSLGTVSGGVVNFSASGGTLGAAATGPHVYITGMPVGFIDGWATVGTDFAEYSTFGVRALTGYYTGALGINVNVSTAVVLLASTSPAGAKTLTNAGTTTDSALNLTDAATIDLGTDPTRTLNLASGGLLKSSVVASVISGSGRLTAGGTAARALSVSVGSTSTLTISSSIINNAGPDAVYGNGDDGIVSLAFGGGGTLVLGGNNTFTGGAKINAGSVRISADSNLGAATGSVTLNGGTLNVTSGFTAAATRVFSVAADLTGTLDIDSAQTFVIPTGTNLLTTGNTASTLIKAGAGMLAIASSNPSFDGIANVNSGTLELRAAQALGDASNRGSIVLNGGSLSLRADSSTNFANAVTASSAATLNVDRLTGTLPAVTHQLGALTIGATTLNFTSGSSSTVTFTNTALTGSATLNSTTATASLGAVTGSFGFTKTGAGKLLIGSGSSYSGATTVSAGTLALSADNAGSSVSALTLAAGTTLDLAGFSGNFGSLSGSGNVTLGAGILHVGFDGTSTTHSGVISGSGGLAKTGSGTFTLSGANTFTGETTISGGTLRLGAAGVLADTSAITLASSGSATLSLNNFNETVGSLAGGGFITLGSATLTFGANDQSTAFSGVISGTGSLTKVGAGTQRLSGANSFTGSVTVNAGSLQIEDDSALGGTSTGTTVSSGAELALAADVSVGNEPLNLSGSGIAGGGALRNLSGANGWAGPISLLADSTIGASSGSLQITGAITIGGRTLTFGGSGDVTAAGVLSGTGGTIIKTGTGTLTLAAANTFTGQVTVSAGILNVEDNSALGGITFGTIVSAGATLQIEDDAGLTITDETLVLTGSGFGGIGALQSVSGANTWTAALTLAADSTVNVLTDTLTLSSGVAQAGGTRTFTKIGAGTLVFGGGNTFSGGLVVGEGTVQIAAAERVFDTTPVTVSTGALLDLNDFTETIGSLSGDGLVDLGTTAGTQLIIGGNNASTTFSGAISGTGTLVKNGTGTTSLTGTNSFTALTINGGVLAISSGSAVGSGTITINAATLQALAPLTISVPIVSNTTGAKIDTNGQRVLVTGTISGPAKLEKIGTGTLEIGSFSGAVAFDIKGGVLQVSGQAGGIDIEAGGALSGDGIVGSISAFLDANLAPGTGNSTLRSGNLSLLSGSHFVLQISGPGTTQHDAVSVTGTISIAGDVRPSYVGGYIPPDQSNLFVVGGTNIALEKYFVVINDGSDAVSGVFSNQVTAGNRFNGLVPTISIGGIEFAVSYSGDFATNSFTGGNDVVLVPIPEPSAVPMIAGGLALLWLASRRRSRVKRQR